MKGRGGGDSCKKWKFLKLGETKSRGKLHDEKGLVTRKRNCTSNF